MANEISFHVYGTPQQRGSKKPFVVNGKARMADANQKSRPWMEAVAAAAGEAMGGKPRFSKPVYVCVMFEFRRPKSHHVAGKRERPLKPTAPQYHTSTPDVDKLVRAIGDGMSGVVYDDDRQIADLSAVKLYTESSEGARITVREIESSN